MGTQKKKQGVKSKRAVAGGDFTANDPANVEPGKKRSASVKSTTSAGPTPKQSVHLIPLGYTACLFDETDWAG